MSNNRRSCAAHSLPPTIWQIPQMIIIKKTYLLATHRQMQLIQKRGEREREKHYYTYGEERRGREWVSLFLAKQNTTQNTHWPTQREREREKKRQGQWWSESGAVGSRWGGDPCREMESGNIYIFDLSYQK